VVDASGAFGVGGFPSDDAQVEIDSSEFRPWAVLGNGYSAQDYSSNSGDDGIYGFGGDGDLLSGGTGGGWGLFGVGGYGTSEDGVGGLFAGGNDSTGGDGIYAEPGSGYAGNFSGDVNVQGTIFASSKDFKIDHPLDPANKYLYHASVESSEMMNIYSGNVTTDAGGEATVKLPDWFEALNGDFRYQLTVIGTFAQAIIAHEIENGQFGIRTSAGNVKVSWEVTAVRHDAFAKAHPLVVEQEKEAKVRGFYVHPELYGAPAQKQIEWARNPRAMKDLQDRAQVRAKEKMMRMQQKQLRPAAPSPAAPKPAAPMKTAALAQPTHLVK
jgi:trimeric autotransporter adhesin